MSGEDGSASGGEGCDPRIATSAIDQTVIAAGGHGQAVAIQQGEPTDGPSVPPPVAPDAMVTSAAAALGGAGLPPQVPHPVVDLSLTTASADEDDSGADASQALDLMRSLVIMARVDPGPDRWREFQYDDHCMVGEVKRNLCVNLRVDPDAVDLYVVRAGDHYEKIEDMDMQLRVVPFSNHQHVLLK